MEVVHSAILFGMIEYPLSVGMILRRREIGVSGKNIVE